MLDKSKKNKILTLKKREDFLRLSKSKRLSTPLFTLQCHSSEDTRFGLTITKKIGTAPARNRIRRRLKAALAKLLKTGEIPERHEYVLIARHGLLHIPFEKMTENMAKAVKKITKNEAQK